MADCKKFVKNVNEKLVEKLTKGATINIAGVLSYEEYEKKVTRAKSVNIKKAFIDVKVVEIM